MGDGEYVTKEQVCFTEGETRAVEKGQESDSIGETVNQMKTFPHPMGYSPAVLGLQLI